jgi:hypothetical protein
MISLSLSHALLSPPAKADMPNTLQIMILEANSNLW